MNQPAASAASRLSFVEASLNFTHPDSEMRLLDETDRSKSVRRFDPHTVRIHDARPIERGFSIDDNGFTLMNRSTAVRDFSNADEVSRVYFPEVDRLIKELTGAEEVFIFGPALRTDSPDRGKDVRQPATAPHVDYSEKMVRHFIRDMAGEARAEQLMSRRFMLINVWRPLRTVERSPLALCDAATVKRDDLVLAYVKGSVASKPGEEPLVSEGYNVFFNPAQRWYYFPRQQANEVLVFRLCDSDKDAIQYTAHTAFEDPTSPPNAAFRESYEIRTIAIMPD
jgi:hypothetical protein